MSYKLPILFFFLFFISNLKSQTTYFIKYKDNVDKTEVEAKVISKQVITSKPGLNKLANNNYSVGFFAKGLGKVDKKLSKIIKVTFNNPDDAQNFLELAQNDNSIEYVQPENVYQVDYVPNDSLANQQWALQKIQAFDAWNITQGSDTVLLAIIDTGIEFFHPDLKNKIYYNPGENGLDQLGRDKRSNGIDDDSNGFVDDYMGWDFVDEVGVPVDTSAGDFHDWDNFPYDYVSGSYGNHGTLVGGTAGAESNNISGIAGVAPNIKLLNIRAFDNGGSGEEDDAAAAILYAVKMGAKVINMSWGDYSFSYVLRDVIKYAYSQNVVLVGSAGNQNVDTPHYPSAYSEVISVSGSTQDDFTAFNWGSTIDLIAPSISILSTTVNSGYAEYSGTSAAAPHVSAAASLILSLGNFTNEEVKQILKSTSVDIGNPGWDLNSGAGRLNLFKALSVLAPAKVKFNFPTMDYATNGNSIEINATALSPYFIDYNLEVGSGENPAQWTILIENGRNQFSDENIYNLDIGSFPDSVYTLRLLVFQNNGGTLEERINFHVMRSPPKVTEVGLGPLYYGDRSTIAGEFLTDQPSIMRMYYRKTGKSNFNFVTLDGFNTNNQFVKTEHYGFIPKEIVEPGATYSIYFEAENLAGLKTRVVDTVGRNIYFVIHVDNLPEQIQNNLMPFSLLNGTTLFPEPVSFLSGSNNEILFQPFKSGNDAIFYNYSLENNDFSKVISDSLLNRFPLIYGDFNNNGLKDLIAINFQNIITLEQTQTGSFSFSKKDSTNMLFYPLVINDVLNNGDKYLISQNDKPDRYLLWKVNNDLSFTLIDSTFYVAEQDVFGSNNTTRNMIVSDTDNDGTKEIWFLDDDGDLKSFKVNPNLTLTKSDSFYTTGLTPPFQQKILDIGDYDGDGKKDIAVLYQTNSVAPTFLLLIISFENHNSRIITQKIFLDQSQNYGGGLSLGSKIYQSLKFVDIDNDNIDELVLNIFPYTYILKYSNQKDKIIFYTEGSNTENVFVGDINQDGVTEIGLKINDEYKFFEFSNSNRTPVPVNLAGFSINSGNIKLTWQGSAEKYYIYKGSNINNLSVIDSVFQTNYQDTTVSDSTIYYYGVKAYDAAKTEPSSDLSNLIKVYSHTPAVPLNAISNSNKSVIVTFSEKMKNVIENLESFEIPGVGFPNSVSANNQYSYLLTFKESLPIGESQLIVKDINDLYDSPISADTLIFNVIPTPETQTFYISSFEIITPHRIKLTFNFDVDEISASDTKNYLFDPENKVVNIEFDNTNKNVIYLDLDDKKPVGSIGKEYRLQAVNLKSSAGTGSLNINTGAGSYVILTSYAKDLSDIFVYPNPVSAGRVTKITFANLPKRARIDIFTINGDKVSELEEKDGNGGVDFNLKYDSGKELNSGIYIYRVVMLDDSDNEIDTKIGKFAIVK